MPTKRLPEEIRRNRLTLKERLLDERGWQCEVCQLPFNSLDMHEGLVTFNDISRVKDKRVDKIIALSPANLFLICKQCHLYQKPSKQVFYDISKKRSEKELEEFYSLIELLEETILKTKLPKP